jgi:hypothetical protein
MYEFTISGGSAGFSSDKLKFLAKSVQTPSQTIGVIDVNYMGMIHKAAGDVTFDDLTVTVMLDINYEVRKQLETWMAKIRGRGHSQGASSYSASAVVKHLNHVTPSIDGEAKDIVIYTFNNLWPNNISAIDLSYDSRDTIAEYTVTFSYDFWTTGDNQSQPQ